MLQGLRARRVSRIHVNDQEQILSGRNSHFHVLGICRELSPGVIHVSMSKKVLFS
jgi:hypothetical protein